MNEPGMHNIKKIMIKPIINDCSNSTMEAVDDPLGRGPKRPPPPPPPPTCANTAFRPEAVIAGGGPMFPDSFEVDNGGGNAPAKQLREHQQHPQRPQQSSYQSPPYQHQLELEMQSPYTMATQHQRSHHHHHHQHRIPPPTSQPSHGPPHSTRSAPGPGFHSPSPAMPRLYGGDTASIPPSPAQIYDGHSSRRGSSQREYHHERDGRGLHPPTAHDNDLNENESKPRSNNGSIENRHSQQQHYRDYSKSFHHQHRHHQNNDHHSSTGRHHHHSQDSYHRQAPPLTSRSAPDHNMRPAHYERNHVVVNNSESSTVYQNNYHKDRNINHHSHNYDTGSLCCVAETDSHTREYDRRDDGHSRYYGRGEHNGRRFSDSGHGYINDQPRHQDWHSGDNCPGGNDGRVPNREGYYDSGPGYSAAGAYQQERSNEHRVDDHQFPQTSRGCEAEYGHPYDSHPRHHQQPPSRSQEPLSPLSIPSCVNVGPSNRDMSRADASSAAHSGRSWFVENRSPPPPPSHDSRHDDRNGGHGYPRDLKGHYGYHPHSSKPGTPSQHHDRNQQYHGDDRRHESSNGWPPSQHGSHHHHNGQSSQKSHVVHGSSSNQVPRQVTYNSDEEPGTNRDSRHYEGLSQEFIAGVRHNGANDDNRRPPPPPPDRRDDYSASLTTITPSIYTPSPQSARQGPPTASPRTDECDKMYYSAGNHNGSYKKYDPQPTRLRVEIPTSPDAPNANGRLPQHQIAHATSDLSQAPRTPRVIKAEAERRKSKARSQILKEISQATNMRETATDEKDRKFWDRQIMTLNESFKKCG